MQNTRTCDKCKQSIPMTEIKMYPKEGDRVWLVCKKCVEELKKKTVHKPLKMTAEDETTLKPVEKKHIPGKIKENYVCKRCKFNFSIDTDKQKARCPYCGKDDISLIR
ncbi:hypothetical protein JW968_03630 [Candidatus Woesearchaeota archaeon]|nr:hypothetical protein [Candidatus Woesearchaeota archaeon]